MNKSNDLRRGRTCVFQLHVHLVFVTKYRRNIFTSQIFASICQDFESKIVEMDGEKDHIHLFILSN